MCLLSWFDIETSVPMTRAHTVDTPLAMTKWIRMGSQQPFVELIHLVTDKPVECRPHCNYIVHLLSD